MPLDSLVQKLTFVHWNVGRLAGPVRRNRTNYVREVVKNALYYFIPSAILGKKVSHKSLLPSGYYRELDARILDIIETVQNADVLTLNEADSVFPGVDIIKILQEATKLKYAVHDVCYDATFGPFTFAKNGNAVLSRYPIKETRSIRIDKPKFYPSFLWERGWGRKVLHAVIDFGNFEYDVLCTHFHTIGNVRDYQAYKLREIIEQLGKPCIVAGDLNTTLQYKMHYPYGDRDSYDSVPLRILHPALNESAFAPEFTMFGDELMEGTYPVMVRGNELDLSKPADRTLDYILPTIGKGPIKAKAENLKVPKSIASDHFPVESRINFWQAA